MMKEICGYSYMGKIGKNGCKILKDDLCDGTKENCSFRKTELQIKKDNDNAIDICRAKGLCETCNYCASEKRSPCKKSNEAKEKSNA